ncbi:hypothetical protein C922_05427 [Plasmodium inui San Antonio 1]|uniref:Uncharacterized protein n=1 Tax=Plasmodium inui San Antonio 1 TaxID=1237626 RepID=W6ZY30_9APIC|nr:hypothetical protein C922_05427 [Plasmodium inui San Antonio 1]EUD64190.1 hypothetical protein C922_05427 [Plasmodium inui San Antonio 1]
MRKHILYEFLHDYLICVIWKNPPSIKINKYADVAIVLISKSIPSIWGNQINLLPDKARSIPCEILCKEHNI